MTQGWAAGAAGPYGLRPAVWHTTDGGASWQDQFLGGRGRPESDVVFVDDRHGWLATRTGAPTSRTGWPLVGRTTDGGAHWKFVRLHDYGSTAVALSFVSAKRGWVACSPDSGRSGTDLPHHERRADLEAPGRRPRPLEVARHHLRRLLARLGGRPKRRLGRQVCRAHHSYRRTDLERPEARGAL